MMLKRRRIHAASWPCPHF